MRFLLDTNILLPLEDSKLLLQPSLANFVRLANAHGHELLYHPASEDDIRQDRDEGRRNQTLHRLSQYSRLPTRPTCPWNEGVSNRNDVADNEILYALELNAAHALVTEDQGIHGKARAKGLVQRVYTIQTADDLLRRLHEQQTASLPNIEDLPLYSLTPYLDTPFFDGLREGYDGFNAWFAEKAQAGRNAWVNWERPGVLGGICIYARQVNEAITDDITLTGPALKLATFKVGDTNRGKKVGELFLKMAFRHASLNRLENIFIHGDVDQHRFLFEMLEDFGFSHYLDPTEEGARLRGEMLIPRIQAYLDNDCTTAKGAIAGLEGAYARRLTIHGHEVGIVGINTAWLSKGGNDDERNLTPGKPLLEKALEDVKDADLRIVLGHHPIGWFIPAQQKPINSLLGKHQVLYLHGHLHDAWAEPTYGSGHTYLAIRAGAGFQAREGEKWRNGLAWGEVDMNAGEVRLQARHWSHNGQDWPPAWDEFDESHRQGDWWHYPLPGTQAAKADYTPAPTAIDLPPGWAVFKPADLARHLGQLTPEDALRYFDGAVPDWSTALSASIPRRGIVARLVAPYRSAEAANRPIVSLLLAAGCEGKTTALLQAAYDITKSGGDWRILQRRDESQPLNPEAILPVLAQGHTWLLVLDEADRAAGELLALLKRLPPNQSVHALLACRDTDWRASNADSVRWDGVADFHKEALRGVDAADAQAIVQAWQAYGKAGLGDLADKDEDKRAAILEQRSKEKAKIASGTLFGALLAVRSGSDLRNHARLLLERLGQLKIRSGGSLRDALAYIAAMHGEGLEFLSRPVLTQALGCPPERLHKDVLLPLGQEAAATTTSSFIYTRDQLIAETLVSVLEEEFGEDIGTLYVTLGESAITAFVNGTFVPELGSWRFDLSNHFLAQGRQELAFNIARAVLDQEPLNSMTRTHVANLYRKANQPEQAVRVFREAPGLVKGDRGYCYEWGVAEGGCGHQADGLLLQSFSLCDQCPAVLVDNNQAKNSLAGLGVAFGALYDAYANPAFRDARMAVAVLGQTLRLDPTARGYFQTHAREVTAQGATRPNPKQALLALSAGIVAAAQIGLDATLTDLLPKAEALTFAGLQQLVQYFIYSAHS
jgi:tetratricopeptide (TPR) repeat protein